MGGLLIGKERANMAAAWRYQIPSNNKKRDTSIVHILMQQLEKEIPVSDSPCGLYGG